MGTFPLEILNAQSAPWCYPGAWLALLTDATSVDREVLLTEVLRAMVDPPSLEHVLREYLRAGQYEAVQRALEDPRVGEQLGEGLATELERTRQRQIQRSLAEIDERVTLLRLRSARLLRPVADLDSVAETAREAATRQAGRGARILDEMDRELASAETREGEDLTRRLEEEDRADAHAIARAIQTGAYDVARLLLGSEEDGEAPPLTHRALWPYGVDARRFIRWLRAPAPDRPPGFLQQWALRPGDYVAEDLLDAVERLVNGEPPDAPHALTPLARALEHVLGQPAASEVPDRSEGRIFVRGVQRPGFYTFHDERYVEGLELTHVDLEVGNATRDDDRYFLCIGDSNRLPQHPRLIHLDWIALLCLLREPDRPAALMRLIGEQVRPEDAFPETMPPDGDFVLGRGELVDQILAGDAPVLWIAPAGAGKTSLLRAAAREAAGHGWYVRWLDDAQLPRDAPSPSGRAQVLLLFDGLERLDPADQQHLWEALSEWTTANGMRLAGAGRPECLGNLPEGSWRPLSPLSHVALAAVLLHLLDALGAAYQDRRVIDRLVYYAGGHVGVLHTLLRHLARSAAVAEDGWIMEAETIDRVFHHPEVQNELRENLLGWLHADPFVRLVLAACLVLPAQVVGGFTALEIGAMLREFGVDADSHRVERTLAHLEAGYLLGHNGEAWRLPPSGIGTLLRTDDPEANFMEAVLAVDAAYGHGT
jgi:hypothetical protein